MVLILVGGEILEYPDDSSSPAASILDSKLLFNSTISDARRGARFISYYFKVLFLETPMSRAEYMSIHSKYFSPDIRDRYNIGGLISADGYVYIKIIRRMYELNQADIIAKNNLISHMDPCNYYPVPFTTGLWSHKTRKKMLMCG